MVFILDIAAIKNNKKKKQQQLYKLMLWFKHEYTLSEINVTSR